jgi:ABC-2 type transport system permease protein
MNPRASIWIKTVYARTWVRTKSIYGEPLWVAVNVGFPFFTSLALSLLYSSAGLKSGIGFAFLGGVMVSFWGNVLWSMASQFNWDKQQGLFELYITSPAPISAILIGMSLGGILGTAPSAITLAIVGWILFAPPGQPFVAPCRCHIRSDSCILVRYGNGAILTLSSVWTRGRFS